VRTLTPAALTSINEQDTDEVWLLLAKLEHSNWAGDPVLITRDSVDTTHNGETYVPYPFDATLPSEPKQGVPVVQFVASNIDLEITRRLLAVTDFVTVTLTWVLASNPNTPVAGPYPLRMLGFSGNASELTAELQSRFNFEQPVVSLNMTPSNAPAIF
jgi:hypothetical protein